MKKKNINDIVKEQRIKNKAKILHQEALRKEELLSIDKKTIQPDDIDKMNDMLFESIEAKLSLLNDFSQK